MRIPSLLEQRVRDQMIIILESLPSESWEFKFTGEESWLFLVQTGAKKEKISSSLYNHLTKMLPVLVTWDRNPQGLLIIKILEKPRKGERFVTHITERSE